MKIISKIEVLVSILKTNSLDIHFIPTMGALHQGHLSLINQAKSKNALIIVSIFVNKLQFNNSDDFQKYPQTLGSDIKILKNLDIDLVFTPHHEDIYPDSFCSNIMIDNHLNKHLEAQFRPGHFNGVATIISKLLNIVKPNKIFLGQKDAQQIAIIQKLIIDFNYPTVVVTCSTVRETNNLAMSSRNQLLSQESFKKAGIIYESLNQAKTQYNKQNRLKVKDIYAIVKNHLSKQKDFHIEYLNIVNVYDFMLLEDDDLINQKSYLLIAGYIESIRLLDNIILNPERTKIL